MSSRRVLIPVVLWLGCAGPLTGRLAPPSTDVALRPQDPGFHDTLQIHWLGAACHLIQLGDRAILTDPFVSRQRLWRVALGSTPIISLLPRIGIGSVRSDASLVRTALGDLPAARAIFVGHSHYDHLLDAPELLGQPRWKDVPIYGSRTTRNLLVGFGKQQNWRQTIANGRWHDVAPGVRYSAVVTEHAPQIARFMGVLYPRDVSSPLRCPPRHAAAFQLGDVYAYVFELSNEAATFRVYFVGAAASSPRGFPPASVKPVAVAILCVPSWDKVDGYPDAIIRRLEAPHVVLSHFDDFFDPDSGSQRTVAFADLEGFLRRARSAADYAGFPRMLVPRVGSVTLFRR